MQMIIEFYTVNIFVKEALITSVGPRRDGPGRAGQAGLSKTKIGPGGPEEYLGRYGPGRARKNGPISRPVTNVLMTLYYF